MDAHEDDELDWPQTEGWTAAEVEYYLMGPFDGGIPGLVRRVRRVLDVSQRGLAALLGVSQSVVARWETRRTSPRADVLLRMLRLARLRVRLEDDRTGREVGPMRDDGDRDRAGRRFPAHVDLRVTGWWMPRDAMSTGRSAWWRARSRQRRMPSVRYHLARRHLVRRVFGTPVDHPAHHQHLAEAHHLDDLREDRRLAVLARRHGTVVPPPSPPGGLSA